MNESLLQSFKALKLYYLQGHFEDFTKSFNKLQPTAVKVIENLVEHELQEQSKRSYERRMKEAKIGRFKPIADFDWNWPKNIERNQIEQFFSLEFLKKQENIVLLGPQGVGKTMIAKNLAYTAADRGSKSLFTTASEISSDLNLALNAGVFHSRIKKYFTPDLLVIDELGYLSYDHKVADALFDIISKRYEKKSVIISTNLAFVDWPTVFPGASCIQALVDRLTHHCHIVTVDAESFRFKESQQQKKLRESKS